MSPTTSAPDARERFGRALRLHLVLWFSLVALTALSLFLAYVPLGPFNLLVGIAIAVAQIAILGLFFMSLRQAPTLILITAGSAFVFLLSMFVLTLNDLFTRV